MGVAISAIHDQIKVADRKAEEKAKQDLDILQKMVDAQLDRYESEMTQKVSLSLSDPCNIDKMAENSYPQM